MTIIVNPDSFSKMCIVYSVSVSWTEGYCVHVHYKGRQTGRQARRQADRQARRKVVMYAGRLAADMQADMLHVQTNKLCN